MLRQTYDVFTLTELSFDPPVKTRRRGKKAISEAVSKLSNQLGRETRQFQSDAFQAQIDFLDQKSTLSNTAGWMEALKVFMEMAEKSKSQERERVQFATSLLVQNGIKSFNKGVLRSFRLKTGLSAETLTQVFVKSGLELSPNAFSEKLPKFPVNGERILLELERLRETKDPNPNGSDTPGITDLYAFAAYLMDDLSHADLYKNLSTSELKTIVDLAARKYSSRNDELGKLCGSISASASRYVFNSDDNRNGYEALTLYHHIVLQSLFDALRMLPDDIILQSDFAEKCIKLIGVFFPDYETAVSICNKEENLTKIPYGSHMVDVNGAAEFGAEYSKVLKHSKSRVYGINLGSAYSAVAMLDDNKMPEGLTKQEDCSDLIASAVYLQEGMTPIVGEVARNQKDIDPDLLSNVLFPKNGARCRKNRKALKTETVLQTSIAPQLIGKELLPK